MMATGVTSMSLDYSDYADSDFEIDDDTIASTTSRAGRPLRTVPVDDSRGITPGDHILYVQAVTDSRNEEYRPIYRSALVEVVSKEYITVIVYTSHGVQQITQEFRLFQSVHKVDYTANAFHSKIAVRNAQKRLGENLYHALFNNSHHFVTKAKTGLEYSMADLIHAVQEPWRSDYELKPVLMKCSLDKIEDIEPGDHIMDTSDQHWLVESVDITSSTFTAYTTRGKHVTTKSKPWRDNLFKIQYPQSNVEPSTILQKAHTELKNNVEWRESDKFVTKMKWGRAFAISDASLLDSNSAPLSCTRVSPHIVLDRGDHLLVKVNGKNYRSVLIEAILDADTIVCMPDINGVESRGDISISEQEVYRVNYSQHLPPGEVISRAESKEGQQLLQSCQHYTSRFVSWAVSGRSVAIDPDELIKNQELKMVTPVSYKRVTRESFKEVQAGDHLFVDYRYRYRWHFMVTEVYAKPNYAFKTIYCLHGSVKETVEKVNPEDLNVYKVIYEEELVPEEAIARARSKVGRVKLSKNAMWERLDFVRWAKTGSDDGVEIDIMTNCSTPTSKSRITSFQQLNPGDYFVIEESKLTPFHHCLVLEVASSEYCTVMEVWNRMVIQTTVRLDTEHKYYRLNYSMSCGVCRLAKESITLARDLARVLKKSLCFRPKYTRQTFVNYLKTGEDLKKVDVNQLQDDRLLLPRETIKSAMQLKRGDHIERPLKGVGQITDYCHHMMVLKPLDERHCEVVHCTTGRHHITGSAVRIETVDIFVEGIVSRVKYAERIDPEAGITTLLQLADSNPTPQVLVGQSTTVTMKRVYSLLTNNCEHVVMIATIGEPMSIQVSIDLYQCLHQHIQAMSPGLGDACVRATSKGAIKTVAKVAGTAIIRVAGRAALRSGGSAVAQAGADAAESSLNAALANSFRIGYTAALSATTVGLVGGIALGANLLFESPLLLRSLYKIHRKKKFSAITKTQAKKQATVETITSASTVVGGVGGAILGQVLIPVPVLGAAVGGFAGVLAGKACGYGEGKLAAALFVSDGKKSDLPVIINCVYTSIIPVSD